MKKISLEDLMFSVILTFCENAAELGCPKDKEVDMWFREFCYNDNIKIKDIRKMMNKILEIQRRDENV